MSGSTSLHYLFRLFLISFPDFTMSCNFFLNLEVIYQVIITEVNIVFMLMLQEFELCSTFAVAIGPRGFKFLYCPYSCPLCSFWVPLKVLFKQSLCLATLSAEIQFLYQHPVDTVVKSWGEKVFYNLMFKYESLIRLLSLGYCDLDNSFLALFPPSGILPIQEEQRGLELVKCYFS